MIREDITFHTRTLLATPDVEAFSRLMRSAPVADIADALRDTPPEQIARILGPAEPKETARLFVTLSDSLQDRVLAQLSAPTVSALVSAMPADERADLYNRLDTQAQQRLLPSLSQAERDDILRLSNYPEGSAGSAATSQYATIDAAMTAEQALRVIRATAPDKETIYVIYVVDTEGRLTGTVSLRDLVLADADAPLTTLVNTAPVHVRADDSDEKAAEHIRRYDLLAVPVVTHDDKMIGIVTVDDAMDIDKEQDATQLARYGGTAPLGGSADLDLKKSTFRQIFGTRLMWLLILTVFGILTSSFVAKQEEILAEVIVLAAFIAPIVDMGGNTGSQSATLVIRSMALGQLRLRWADVWFVVRRECVIALALGVCVAVLEIILANFTKSGLDTAVLTVVGLSMLICTALGGIIGAVLPFLARRIGTDPATLSSPLITSIMDLLGVFVYFGLAYAFLGHLLV
ncbi:magnesium transporter [Streptomyces sp. N35]|uniref:magnesium transporter n=1 Tax=Streptomyces sp. N35 TaxID=2795730 RepID=UPI0018F642ED|nr:magnesium transporter [Streptomyces sp. N35]